MGRHDCNLTLLLDSTHLNLDTKTSVYMYNSIILSQGTKPLIIESWILGCDEHDLSLVCSLKVH